MSFPLTRQRPRLVALHAALAVSPIAAVVLLSIVVASLHLSPGTG